MSFLDPHEIVGKPTDLNAMSGILDIIKRSERFGRAKIQSKRMSDFMGDILDQDEYYFDAVNPRIERIYERVKTCADWLRFRHYIDHDETRLTAANFCNHPLLCQCCAIRRGGLLLQKHHQNIEQVISENPRLKAFMLTITVANGENLSERYEHLKSSFKRLQANRRRFIGNPDRYAFTEFAKIEGAVFSYEIPKTKDGSQWNPHIHMLILCENPPDVGFVNFDKDGNYLPEKSSGLRDEWYRITGDSFMIDCQNNGKGKLIDMCMEVMKYAVKFSDQEPSDTWELFRCLNGLQLFGSFGVLRGVKIPKNLLDEPLSGAYYEYTLKYFSGGVYELHSYDDCTQDYETPSRIIESDVESLSISECEASMVAKYASYGSKFGTIETPTYKHVFFTFSMLIADYPYLVAPLPSHEKSRATIRGVNSASGHDTVDPPDC
ncbi:MAG: protein rep [Mariprofundaceae bacterium]|nr:protein rep [Mariprofundaceae bacterium]